jgi:hypothetical protein
MRLFGPSPCGPGEAEAAFANTPGLVHELRQNLEIRSTDNVLLRPSTAAPARFDMRTRSHS